MTPNQARLNGSLTRLDKLIGYAFPMWGYRRAAARARTNGLRRYEGAISNRLSSWLTSILSADAELPYGDRQALIANVRELIQNDPHAAGAVQHRVHNIVGEGVIVTPAVLPNPALGITESMANQLNEQAALAWADWRRQCDIGERHDFTDILRLVVRDEAASGESLIRRAIRKKPVSGQWSTAVEVIDPDRLASGMPRTSADIRDGVEIGGDGQPVAYWIVPHHPGGVHVTGDNNAVRILAEDMLHYYLVLRPGQTRGVPWLANCISLLRKKRKYQDLELVAATVQNLFCAFIKTQSPDAFADVFQDDSDSRGNPIKDLEPGKVRILGENQDVTFGQPSHPNSNYDGFMRSVLQAVARGTGLSYENLSMDRTDASYSSERSGRLVEQDGWRIAQRRLATTVCKPLYRWFYEEAVIEGRINVPAGMYAGNRSAFQRCVVRGRGWHRVDPEKEAKADVLAHDADLLTEEEYWANRGQDWRTALNQLAAEKKYKNDLAKRLGLAETVVAAPNEDQDDSISE